ncbi:unnamed protein product [Hydatigera taeniaeformis]|uniref:t-SNARE coiled-coil homology domain-containing protein n=1 Tax=Hydatigena taeniaeformis TaxID=6205 RepID=A0A0R3X0L3_HYDTA|nr:unnamed protein product [Hydatigera taeniaeformis]
MLNLFSRSTGRHYSNRFEYSSTNISRRQSVTPSGKTFRRHTFEGTGTPSTPLASPRHTSKAALLPGHPESMDRFTTTLEQLSGLLGWKRKESFQPEFFEAWDRHTTLLSEFREIMGLVEHIEKVYEASKNQQPLARFKQLKACIQRTHLFLQVCAVHSSVAKDVAMYYSRNGGSESDLSFQRSIQRGSVIGSLAKEAEAFRIREQAFDRVDLQQLMSDLGRLKEENEVLTVQSKLLLAELKWLCDRYTDMQGANPISKYFFLKRIIRKVIYGDTLREVSSMKSPVQMVA